ncbi:MAG TPA: hypothetical protein VFL29_10920 [Candidatus Dormibacteraeota bacterium]|nr:hypothetical protein [Candidatus Dormibacteraeota bacterium]
MNDAVVSEFLIALFAGMVAFAIMRRGTSRPVELVLWVGLVWVCVLGVTSTHDKQTRELTSAAVWGSTQIMGTIAGLMGQGALGWVSANRMAVADWVVLIFGLDLLAIVLLRTHRKSAAWQPRVRLRDWMEMPRLGKPQPAPVPAVSGVDEVNQRFNRWAPLATAGALMQLTLFLIWSLDVLMPATGRRLRDAVTAAQGARRRVASGEKIVDFETLAGRAASVRGWASGAINQVASAPQFDWMSGYAALPPRIDGGIEIDDESPHERDRRDRLAS